MIDVDSAGPSDSVLVSGEMLRPCELRSSLGRFRAFRLFLFEQTVREGIVDELGAGRRVELVEHMVQVPLDGAWADTELMGDGLVRHPPGHEADDFLFPCCQPGLPSLRCRPELSPRPTVLAVRRPRIRHKQL